MIEIILVLSILALALALVSIDINRIYKNGLLRNSIANVQEMLGRARAVSLTTGEPVAFNTNGSAFWLEREGKLYGKPLALPAGSFINSGEVFFFPKGQSSGGEITVTGPRERKNIIEVDKETGAARLRRF